MCSATRSRVPTIRRSGGACCVSVAVASETRAYKLTMPSGTSTLEAAAASVMRDKGHPSLGFKCAQLRHRSREADPTPTRRDRTLNRRRCETREERLTRSSSVEPHFKQRSSNAVRPTRQATIEAGNCRSQHLPLCIHPLPPLRPSSPSHSGGDMQARSASIQLNPRKRDWSRARPHAISRRRIAGGSAGQVSRPRLVRRNGGSVGLSSVRTSQKISCIAHMNQARRLIGRRRLLLASLAPHSTRRSVAV